MEPFDIVDDSTRCYDISSSDNSPLLETVTIPSEQEITGSSVDCTMECRTRNLRFMVATETGNQDECLCTNEALHDRVDCPLTSDSNIRQVRPTGLGFAPVSFSVDASPSALDFSDDGDLIDTSLIQVSFVFRVNLNN